MALAFSTELNFFMLKLFCVNVLDFSRLLVFSVVELTVDLYFLFSSFVLVLDYFCWISSFFSFTRMFDDCVGDWFVKYRGWLVHFYFTFISAFLFQIHCIYIYISSWVVMVHCRKFVFFFNFLLKFYVYICFSLSEIVFIFLSCAGSLSEVCVFL